MVHDPSFTSLCLPVCFPFIEHWAMDSSWAQPRAARHPHLPPQPPWATGVLKHPLHAYGVDWKLKQHAAHTVQPATSLPQRTVLLYVPQLRGATHLQLPMQPAAVSLPSGSARHCPTVTLQL